MDRRTRRRLSGLVVQTLFVDRAGDLWVGARDGLFRVRAGAVKTPPAFTTNAPTVQALAGLELPVSARFGLFAEYRFEKLWDEVLQETTTVNLRLRTHHVAGGIAIHF